VGQVRELGDDEEIIAAERIGVHDSRCESYRPRAAPAPLPHFVADPWRPRDARS
jgi:hypothetical protein